MGTLNSKITLLASLALLFILIAIACHSQPPHGGDDTQEPPPAKGQLIALSADKTHLVNTFTGQPVFITGDSPQLLMLQISDEDVETYLADRSARGFNAIWVYPADAVDQSNAPRNFYGDAPFNGADFTNENPKYWKHVDHVIQRAAAYNIAVVLDPGFVGLSSKYGYLKSYLHSSDAVMKAYGTWLGKRYRNYTNIVWALGGDADLSMPGLAQKLNDLGTALAAADPNHLITFEACRVCSPAYQSSLDAYPNPPSWLSLNWVYPDQSTAISSCQNNFGRNASIPPLMGEDWYELTHDMTGFDTRAEGYWEVLSGCTLGTMWGNGPLWSFNSSNGGYPTPTWQSQLGSVGSVSQEWMGKLMRSRQHWKLVPDINHAVVTSGYGSGLTTTTTARTSDGQTIIAYIPNGNATTLTVDMSKIQSAKQSASCWWFNPSNGQATQIGTYPTSGERAFTAPDSNDWVLVLDDATSRLKAPASAVLVK